MGIQMKYFVLKPKAKTKGDVFATASQKAMLAYAEAIKKTDLFMAKNLRGWSQRETEKQGKLVE